MQTAGGAQESHFWTHLRWLLLGTGLGALTTYMLDPDRGRRRQALVRDRVVHARTVVRREVPKRVRHVQNRLQGVQHDLGLHNGDASGAADDVAQKQNPHAAPLASKRRKPASVTSPSSGTS